MVKWYRGTVAHSGPQSSHLDIWIAKLETVFFLGVLRNKG